MCATDKPQSQFEDIQELKAKIKVLCRKVIQLKPELEDWVKKNFIESWKDGEEE
jgi:hypothetical protein